MKNYQNIDKSGFRKGEYVGYLNGANRIIRDGKQFRMSFTMKDGRRAGVGGTLQQIQDTCEILNGR